MTTLKGAAGRTGRETVGGFLFVCHATPVHVTDNDCSQPNVEEESPFKFKGTLR